MITETPTPQNIADLLRTCADAAPIGPRDEHRIGWGLREATRLVREMAAKGQRGAAQQALGEMLRSGQEEQVFLAVHLLSPDDLLSEGIDQVDYAHFDPEVQEQVRVATANLTALGKLAYDEKWRVEFAQPGAMNAIPALIIYDHEWFWANAQRVLGGDLSRALIYFGFHLAYFSRDEVDLLRAELADRVGNLEDEWADKLGAYIDDYLADNGPVASEIGDARFERLTAD